MHHLDSVERLNQAFEASSKGAKLSLTTKVKRRLLVALVGVAGYDSGKQMSDIMIDVYELFVR